MTSESKEDHQKAKSIFSDDEWRQKLSEEQYRVLREKCTELPHTGKYNKHFEEGIYRCAGCGKALYDSSSKFDSGCGWPAFSSSVGTAVKREHKPDGHYPEIVCANCGGHLGHVFPGKRYKHKDGRPIEERHCVNSLSIQFEKNSS